MRRSKPLARTPLQRKKALKATGVGLARGKPLERRTPLERGGRIKSRPKPPRSDLERKASEAWRRSVLSRCERDPETKLYICPVCRTKHAAHEMECHHVVDQQRIKKYVAALRLAVEEAERKLISLLWDKRDGLAVCKVCHDKHTMAKERIPFALIPVKAHQFAREIGLDYTLDRYYS